MAVMTRQEIFTLVEVPCTIPCSSRPDRVWTIYDDSLSLPISPAHLKGSFLEDYIHDWNETRDGKGIRFASRAATPGDRVLLEWKA